MQTERIWLDSKRIRFDAAKVPLGDLDRSSSFLRYTVRRGALAKDAHLAWISFQISSRRSAKCHMLGLLMQFTFWPRIGPGTQTQLNVVIGRWWSGKFRSSAAAPRIVARLYPAAQTFNPRLQKSDVIEYRRGA